MEHIHRILSGSPDSKRQLIGAGLFVAVWFGMDLIEFGDWAISKFKTGTCQISTFYGGPVPDSAPHLYVTPNDFLHWGSFYRFI